MLHKEYLLFYIIDLYTKITNMDTIDIRDLTTAFYTLEELHEYVTPNYDFDASLKEFVETFSEYLIYDNKEIIIIGDLDELFNDLIECIEPSYYDDTLEEYVHNIHIYEALDIPIPLEETKETFNLNLKIMHIYTLIAEAEYQKDYSKINLLISYLNILINNLNDEFKTMNEDYLLKIKMCLAKYNECLSDDPDFFSNCGWQIAIFSKNPQEMQKLRHERTEYLATELEYKLTNIEENDNYLSEISIFLTYYLSYLNKYLKLPLPDITREALTIKKYLLLSMPELEHIEKIFLKTQTIENIPLPQINDITPNTFDVLINKVMECSLELDYSNEEIHKKPHLYHEIILNALFIKCFLDLSINENEKKNILNNITNTRYYNLPEYYSITINLINNIIFPNETPKKSK